MVSRSVCLGLKPHIWGPIPDFYYCQTVADLLIWGALSDERTSVLFRIAAGPRQRSHSRETPQTWRARFFVFIFLKNRVAQLYPQALGSLIVASYD
jgi:hypothetical protein